LRKPTHRLGVDALKREEGGIIAVLVIIILIVTVVVLGPWSGNPSPYYNPGESLSHLAAPGEIPGDQVDPIVVGNLTLSVTGFFFTMSPHNNPATFSFDLDVSVNNTGAVSIDDFQVVMVTIFYENAVPVYTFGAIPENNSTIPADSILTLEYENDRDMITVPSNLLIASYVFARVLVTFDVDTEVVLITPMTSIVHAIE